MTKKKITVIGAAALLCFLFISMISGRRAYASEVQTPSEQVETSAQDETETEVPSSEVDMSTHLVFLTDGKIYCYENGEPVKDVLKQVNGRLYYFTSDGSALTSTWRTIDGSKYYFGENGAAYKGSRLIGDKYYVFKENCTLAVATKKQKSVEKGRHIVNYKDKKYFVSKKGVAISGWYLYKYKVVYASKSGRMAVNKKVSYIKFNKKGYAENKYQALAKMEARKFIDKHTKKSWSKKKKLRKCFYYLLHHRHYVAHYVRDHRAYTTNTWQYKAAYNMLSSKRLTGNCRNFAASFAAIAKELGYKPVVWSMKTHSVVKINGKYYDSLYGRGLFGGARRANYKKPNKFKF